MALRGTVSSSIPPSVQGGNAAQQPARAHAVQWRVRGEAAQLERTLHQERRLGDEGAQVRGGVVRLQMTGRAPGHVQQPEVGVVVEIGRAACRERGCTYV